jgi:hypothetical protein
LAEISRNLAIWLVKKKTSAVSGRKNKKPQAANCAGALSRKHRKCWKGYNNYLQMIDTFGWVDTNMVATT